MSCDDFDTETTGEDIAIDFGRDIANATDIVVNFTNLKTNITITKTKIAGEIVIGTEDLFVKNLNETLLANTYALYAIETGFFTGGAGEWEVCSRYKVSNLTPPINSAGEPFFLTVDEAC